MAKRKIKKNKPSLGSLDHKNEYMDFIHICRGKVYSPETKLQIHHIIPIHDGGNNDSQNLIPLSFSDHLEAHKIRYEIYKQKDDLFFLQLVKGNSEEKITLQRQLGATETHRLLKEKKANRWNSEYQRQLAHLSVQKDNGARSRGGKKAGKKRWAGYTLNPNDKYLFYYKENNTGELQPVVCIFNCNDGTEVLDILNQIKPNPKFIRASPLLSGKRKSAYGWSCEKLNL